MKKLDETMTNAKTKITLSENENNAQEMVVDQFRQLLVWAQGLGTIDYYFEQTVRGSIDA